ncbi:unnamed protein product [Brassica rapa subsp. narinosa]|uniref:(rape) hypothetical protein n=1 Tax=Brassica napus TaxID=3708 RepID=A0A816W5L2_BRANA|nr:unnamed protein product [Brassica napus]
MGEVQSKQRIVAIEGPDGDKVAADLKSLRRFEIVESKKDCGGLELIAAELGWSHGSLFTKRDELAVVFCRS